LFLASKCKYWCCLDSREEAKRLVVLARLKACAQAADPELWVAWSNRIKKGYRGSKGIDTCFEIITGTYKSFYVDPRRSFDALNKVS
jgi:hypothetical protein